MRYTCIEAPCSYQSPPPYLLLQFPETMEWKCPFCERVYSQRILDRIFRRDHLYPFDLV